MTAQTDPDTEQPEVPRGGRVWSTGVGLVVAGTAASAVSLLLPTEPPRPDGLPVWVWVAVAGLLVAGIRVAMLAWRSTRLESPRTNPVWWRVARSHAAWWRVALGVDAVVVGTWAVLAGIADIRSGLPGPAIPWLAVGCVALLVATVLLSVSPSPVRRGSVVRQALPAALALVTVVATAVTVDVVGWRIPVDATTAERVDRAGVPDVPGGVRWTSSLPRRPAGRYPASAEVVAAGAGLIVASDDRIVAIDGSTGAERWLYRRAGIADVSVAASPGGRTVLADFTAGGEGFSLSELFAFDADTGELRWRRRDKGGVVTDHVFAEHTSDYGLVGVDLISGEEIWTWRRPSNCEFDGRPQASSVTVLVPVVCRDRADHTFPTVIGVGDRTGTEEWRYTGPPETREDPEAGELTTSRDGRAAWYRSLVRTEPVLLDPATGVVRYRSPDSTSIVASDGRRMVVLLRHRPNGYQMFLRNLITGSEHRLASTCPTPGWEDISYEADTHAVVTPGSDREPGTVLVPCFDSRKGVTPRADVDVYSADGTRLTTIKVDDDVSAVHEGPYSPDLLAAHGAVALVAHGSTTTPAVIVGMG